MPIKIGIRYCGVSDPSWSEIRHFVKFLDLQLKSCQESVYTQPEFVKDVLSGLKGFVVKFMIRMSKVSSRNQCICQMCMSNFSSLRTHMFFKHT